MPVPAVRARRSRSTEDAAAAEVLIAFGRLARGRRRDQALPKHIEALVASGTLAPRHMVAFVVVTLDGPLTVSELAARIGIAISTASLLVTQLAEAGLVERHEDDSDRRRTMVSVAPEHRRESEAVLQSKLAPLRKALAKMGPAHVDVLLEALHIMAEELDRSDGEHTETGAHA